jgi:hypothetical protein
MSCLLDPKLTDFWVMIPCNPADIYQCFGELAACIRVEDRGRKLLQNISKYLADSTASYPRRQQFSWLSLQELQVSHFRALQLMIVNSKHNIQAYLLMGRDSTRIHWIGTPRTDLSLIVKRKILPLVRTQTLVVCCVSTYFPVWVTLTLKSE